MPIEVIMPKVDMDMATGKIALWHVAEGDRVAKGALIFEIETAKAAMEVESPGAGTIHHLLAAGADDVGIGEPVAWIYAEGETLGPPPSQAALVEAAAMPVTVVAAAATEPAPAGTSVRATPLARRLARDNNFALSGLAGTGHNGRISRADVEAALARTVVASPTILAVLSSGTGDRAPYLFIHGLANDASGWLPLVKLLPKDRTIHRLELPSHGRSPHLPAGSFVELARLVTETVDQLKIGKVHLIGHSLGGALAIALAAQRASKIASLTLISPAGLGREIAGDVLQGITRATDAATLGPWLKRLMALPQSVDEAYVQAVATQRRDPALRQAQAKMAAVLFKDGAQSFDLTNELQTLGMPIRIIWGKQDAIIPWAHALNAPGRIALNILDGAGHLPHIEQAALVARIVQEVSAGADASRPL